MSEDKDQYREQIKWLVPINDFPPHLQNEVINIADIVAYKKKEFVFKQGEKDGFSFYILEGEIELLSNNQLQNTIVSGTDTARYPMAQLQPRQFSARAKTAVSILKLERSALDRLMVLDEKGKSDIQSGGAVMEVSDIGEEDSGDWMTKMLQSQLFCRLPTANIHQLFALLEPLEVKAGDTIIKQDDVGGHYYIIQEGRCEVTRSPSPGSKPIKLAELHSGDSFGEEAILTNAKRNASINMLTDGVLMQLSKENFINLIKKPTLNAVSYKDAQKLVDEGACWLDVRFQNEHTASRIEGSINIPLNVLRMQTDKLQSDKKYVIYCDTGGRSSAAAFLLTDRGFNVCYLTDGLVSVPQESKVQESPKPEKISKDEVSKESEIEPGIRASVLEADLAKTNIKLEEAKKQSETKEKDSKAENIGIQKKLEEEKKKLEAEKKVAEKEARKIQEQETEKIKKLKQEAEKRLSDEKKKLEEVYKRNTEEMEKLQRLKKEAEEQIRKEREKLEKESAEAKRKIEEADKLKKQIEDSRKALEQEAEKKRVEQQAMEKAIQEKAKAKLEQERRKLAEEVAKTNEELEKAQREKAVADAARKAAEQEAKKIIEEYKKQYEQERTLEQARLQEERKKLEEESNKIRETLKDVQKTRQDAEITRRAAELDAQKLRERQKETEQIQDRSSRKEVEDEIKVAEAKLVQARKNLEDVQQAEQTIEEAKVVNEQELLRQKEEEERMRKQVAEDLAEWVEEHGVETRKADTVVAHSDHVKRIKERADAARMQAEKATEDLFSDIASQLGGND